jgi:hypothetical protein
MLDCHKAMLRLMGKSVDDTPKPKSGYQSAHAAMREAAREYHDFNAGRIRNMREGPKVPRQTSSRKEKVKYPPVSSRRKATLEEVILEAETAVEGPVIQEPIAETRIEVLNKRDGSRRYEERIEVVNKRTPGRYKLVSTDAMREYMTAVGLMEPNFPQLFALMNEYQAQHSNGRGRRFSGVDEFSGAMLEIHLREAADWVSKQGEFGYVSEPGLMEGEIRAGYLIEHGLITGIHFYDRKGKRRSNEIDCVRLVEGTPLGIETTISAKQAPTLRDRTVIKQKILSRVYQDDCGIAVIVPSDVYENQAEDMEVLRRGNGEAYSSRGNLGHFVTEGGIVVPFAFTRAEFQQAMLDFIPKELDKPELIMHYEAA